jgi:hypothetical protein
LFSCPDFFSLGSLYFQDYASNRVDNVLFHQNGAEPIIVGGCVYIDPTTKIYILGGYDTTTGLPFEPFPQIFTADCFIGAFHSVTYLNNSNGLPINNNAVYQLWYPLLGLLLIPSLLLTFFSSPFLLLFSSLFLSSLSSFPLFLLNSILYCQFLGWLFLQAL